MTAAETDPTVAPRVPGLVTNVLRLVRADFVKLSRYWVVATGFAAIVAMTTVMALLTWYAEQLAGVRSGSGYDFAFGMMIRAVDVCGAILFVMICLIFSLEVSNSTIKSLLTRPITRLELVLSKYVTALSMVVLMLALSWGVSLGAGSWFYGLGDLTENDYVIFEAGYVFRQIFVATLLLLIPFAALAALGLMVSTFSSTTGGAIIIGLILYIVFDSMAILPATLGFSIPWGGEERFVSFGSFGFPSQVFVPMYLLNDLPTGVPVDSWWTWEIQRMLGISLLYFVVFFTAALVGVRRRDYIL